MKTQTKKVCTDSGVSVMSKLAIDLIRLDGDTQSRVAINEDAVADYCEVLSGCEPSEWPFPSCVVFHDGTDYWMADGFHRYLAAERAKRGSVKCDVRRGTFMDARRFAMTANDKNGLRLSADDKRKNVEWLLDLGEPKLQREIAEVAGVSPRTVQRIVASRKPPPPKDTTVSHTSGGGDSRKSTAEEPPPSDTEASKGAAGTEEDGTGKGSAEARRKPRADEVDQSEDVEASRSVAGANPASATDSRTGTEEEPPRHPSRNGKEEAGGPELECDPDGSFLAYANPTQFKMCETLKEAREMAELYNGLVYVPYGADSAVEAFLASQDRGSVLREIFDACEPMWRNAWAGWMGDEAPPRKRNGFQPPSLEEVREYCEERGKGVDPEAWMSHYEANGWKVGRNAMKDWKAAVRTWEKRAAEENGRARDPRGTAALLEKRRKARANQSA